ncbi:hypothetical protein [Treponema sp.]|uniref:hypothetical protein n=1 Tax=Treponema sp. TaxID=166 RepID=UPI00388E798B
MTKEEENQYRRDTYHWRKAHKMCARCGKQDAYTLNGRSKCCECCEKDAENRRRNYDPEKEREKKQRQYAKREAEGKCVRCGRIKSDNGCKICNKCIAEKHQYNQERSQDVRIYRHDLNLCWFCGSQLDGQKKFDGTQSRICSRCYEARLPYIHKAIEQSIKNREERKPTMTTQEIIEGYIKANTKSNYINKTAKSLKKPKSHIIAELFKSGYKYIELQRSFPNEYAAAEKRYQQWLEEGGQEEHAQPDHEDEGAEEIQDSELEVAKKAIDSLENDKAELKNKLAEVESNLLAAHDRIQLESQKHRNEIEEEKKRSFALLTENEKLEEQILQNAERIKVLEAENEELKEKHVECTVSCEECVNDTINDLAKARVTIDRLNADIETATQMFLKEHKKRKKLEKAFLKAVVK